MKQVDFDIRNFLDEQGIEFKEASSGRQLTLAACPRCGKSNKFYISLEKGQFICHYCASRDEEMSGGIVSLVMLLGDIGFKEALKLVSGREVDIPAAQDDSISALLKLDIDAFTFHKQSAAYVPAEMEPPHPIRIPRYMLPIDKSTFPEAWAYLSGRGISDENIAKLGVYVSGLESVDHAARVVGKGCTPAEVKKITSCIYNVFKERIEVIDSKIEEELLKYRLNPDLAKKLTDAIVSIQNKGRIVFPVKIRGLIFGWVARDYTGQNKLKVRNSSGQFKYFCVWNYDQAQTSDELVICEGIVSAIKCGVGRSIATLGKMVTPQQLFTLKKMPAKTVYICLDPDAQREAIELKKRLLPLFKDVYNVSLPSVKLVKCLGCGKKHEVNTDNRPDSIQCACGQLMNGSELLELVNDADYKDAGDYSEEEMTGYINAAREEDPDGFLLGDSAFED